VQAFCGATRASAASGGSPHETPVSRKQVRSSSLLISLLILLAGSGLLPAADQGPDVQVADAQTTQDHPVGAEDLLEISVFEIPELNRTVRVSENGTISLPLLGEMKVKGLTAMGLEGRLREELAKKYLKDPQVSVFVREYGSKKVSVIGAVGKPGVYEMLGPRTLLQVLSQAGGLTEDSGAELYVIRGTQNGGPALIAVNVGDLMANRNPALNVPIYPGDILSVPIDRQVYIYVDGAVKTPGRIEQLSSRTITLLQAIAKAGGATERADLKRAQILRRGDHGTQEVVKVNLKRVRSGKEPDPALQDGDLVVVPETFF
jgi:polysaccharide biosynthesis/export protein